MSKLELTATQRQVLEHAVEGDGRIMWFPDSVKGGARQKVLTGLFNRALITGDGSDWFIAAEGYDAIGRDRPTVVAADDEAATAAPTTVLADTSTTAAETEVTAAEAPAPTRTPRTREHSKQAAVIAMLRRPEGATLAQICASTGWLRHSARGVISGGLKKKLGLAVVSEKEAGGDRVYRLG